MGNSEKVKIFGHCEAAQPLWQSVSPAAYGGNELPFGHELTFVMNCLRHEMRRKGALM